MRLRRILLGTDFSRDAASALQVVRGLALKLHATVRIVHGSQASADNGHVDRRIAKQARDLRSAGVEADGVCVPGDPVETILTQAAVYQADLLAVGTSERRGLSRLILGSVAEALIKRAGCTVLTVRNVGAH